MNENTLIPPSEDLLTVRQFAEENNLTTLGSNYLSSLASRHPEGLETRKHARLNKKGDRGKWAYPRRVFEACLEQLVGRYKHIAIFEGIEPEEPESNQPPAPHQAPEEEPEKNAQKDAETRAGESLIEVELEAAQNRLNTAKKAIKNGHRGLAYSSVQLTIRNLENLLDII